MLIPLVPILGVLAILGGCGTLLWYSGLSEEQQDEANLLAIRMFKKTVQELNRNQSKLLKRRFFG